MYSLLYVDDEPVLLELGKLYLEEAGEFHVTTAESAEDGLAILKKTPVHAVISDYHMADRDGLDFLVEVRSRYGDLPFILFTGRGREAVVIEAINHGVDFYIQKGGAPQAQFAELSHKILQAIRRREAEDELFRSRQMLQLVLDTIPQRVFWKDRNSVFLGCNQPLASDTGYADPAALVGKDDYSTASRDLADQYRADDRYVMETGESKLNFEEPQIKPDGSHAWLRTTKVPLRNREGEIIGVLGTYEDITEQKRVEDALRESEERLRTFFTQMTEAATITDSDGTIIEWNPAAEKLTGIPATRALGRYSWDIQMDLMAAEKRSEGHRAMLQEKTAECLRTGMATFPIPQEVELVRIDGSRVVVRQNIFPIRTAGGFRFGSLTEDITPHMLAGRALRESEERFRDALSQEKDYFAAIFDSVNDAIFIHDAQTGRIVDVNQTCTRMYGYSRDELLSMDVGDFSEGVPPYTQEDAVAWIRRCIRDGPRLFHWRSRRKDGTLFMTEVNMRYARIGDKERIIVTERDITARAGTHGSS